MSDLHHAASESSTVILAKLSVPATITAASFSGITVNQVLVYVTLAYTLTMWAHKLWTIWRDYKGNKREKQCYMDRDTL